ncbi:thiamine pyrophosphate-dependent dehydrogenase E1 component subunit alpha [Prochlorococcus sp. AH-716-A09]|nr:thiamine pyrophosphate-dependent dehydrogenase E1 component subunit alpha [Prochlorococcus sp. AH-716-A09]
MENINFELLKIMTRIRKIESKIKKEYSKQEMRCPVHLSIGQEAVPAALSLLMNKTDFSVSTHRGHAHYLAKGGCLKSLISEIYGKRTGCSKGKGGSMHLIDKSVGFMGTSAIVGNSIPTGTGLALAAKLNGKNQISFIHLGDGAIEEGVFYESLNFACVRNIPAIYICENNFYSVYSPLSVRQPNKRKIYKLAESIGAKSYFEDGNNAINSYKCLRKAIKWCRENNKPVFIEFQTYRTLEHCGPNLDNDLGYRNEKEINKWKNKDPIEFIKRKLSSKNIIKYEKYNEELDAEIEQSFLFAKQSKAPNEEELFTEIFSK